MAAFYFCFCNTLGTEGRGTAAGRATAKSSALLVVLEQGGNREWGVTNGVAFLFQITGSFFPFDTNIFQIGNS